MQVHNEVQNKTFSDFKLITIIMKTMLYFDMDTFPIFGMLKCHLFPKMIVIADGNMI